MRETEEHGVKPMADAATLHEAQELVDCGEVVARGDAEWREAMRTASELAEDTGGATVTVTTKTTFKVIGASGKTEVSHEVKVSPPKRKHATTTVYALGDGSLSARDPRQPMLPGVRSTTKKTARAVGQKEETK
jgi:hypothetical protein